AGGADLGRAGHFGDEPHAARALDAAGHDRLDQRAHVLFFDRALVFVEARAASAVTHRLVLQVAFAALVADRAIERMIDPEGLHHALARLAHSGAFGDEFVQQIVARRRQILDLLRAGGDRLRPRSAADFHFDQAHAAI